jgi:hypothetical protein
MSQLKQTLLQEKYLLFGEKGCKITQNKSVSSREEIQFLDVSTQTDAPTREEFTSGGKGMKDHT